MEKRRLLGLRKENVISWHARNTLSLQQNQINYLELHPNPKAEEAKRKKAMEITVFDIRLRMTQETQEILDIKHRTKEK